MRSMTTSIRPTPSTPVYNACNVFFEQLSQVADLERFADIINAAEDEYLPSGPPMSPLTKSYFSSWAYFDLGIGIGRETLATTALALGEAFGMNAEFARVLEDLQGSRMGVHVHEGVENDHVILRELVDGTTRVCHCPSGYAGKAGEVWLVRVLQPSLPQSDLHVVFTTPYVFLETDEAAWLAYFDRVLVQAPRERRVEAYAKLMKWGQTRDTWNRFVFEAYAGSGAGAVYLRGLPDVAASRPHSDINMERDRLSRADGERDGPQMTNEA